MQHSVYIEMLIIKYKLISCEVHSWKTSMWTSGMVVAFLLQWAESTLCLLSGTLVWKYL